MNNTQLYIDGQLVDIGGDTNISLVFKSNLFRDVAKMFVASTYSIKLPITSRNRMIFGFVDKMQSGIDFARKIHDARVIRNGIEIIRYGLAVVLQVSSDGIDISITWGASKRTNELSKSGKTLDQLEGSWKYPYNEENIIEKFENVGTKAYFYAGYDALIYEDENIESWTGKRDFVYPNVRNESEHIFSFNFGNSSAPNIRKYIHPVVRVSWLLELIKSQCGVSFLFSDEAKSYIDSLVIPLISKKPAPLSQSEIFTGTVQPRDSIGRVQLSGFSSDYIDLLDAGTASVLSCAFTGDLDLNINISWMLNLEGLKPSGSTPSHHAQPADIFDFPYMVYAVMKMKHPDDKEEEYIIGVNENIDKIAVPKGYRKQCTFNLSGVGTIKVKTGTQIWFEWKPILPAPLYSRTQVMTGRVVASPTQGDKVAFGGYVSIVQNLPKIKIMDFVRFLSAITGTYPVWPGISDVINFVPYSTLWGNKKNAVNWTTRVIKTTKSVRPESIDFHLEDYAKRNIFKWKQDDTVKGSYDGIITIDNESLDAEKVIFDFPFAATDGSNIPMYKEGEVKKGEDKPEVSYTACKERILRLNKDSDGYAHIFFDINMQRIIDIKYKEMSLALKELRVIKETIDMRDLDFANFDETSPVYLAQHNAYFAVLEIKLDNTGVAEVTMMKI